MSGELIFPPVYKFVSGPLIFLAGPIQGAPDWQSEAIRLVKAMAPDIHVASPRRKYLDREFVYEAQVDWETSYLRRAAQDGAILFWLAKEAEHRCDRAYAQTTRFELAEWKMRHERDGTKLVVGIEDGFTNARYMRRRLSQDCPRVPIYDNLEFACGGAVRMARKKNSAR